MINKKQKKTFVLIVPRFEDVFNAFYAGEIIKGVSLAASRLKIDILIHITDRSDHRGWLDSSLLDSRYIQGIIFADIDADMSIPKRAIARGIPTMVLNNYFKYPLNCVAIDNYQAGIDSVEYLVKKGHECIATIAGEQRTQAGQMRLQGFFDACQTIGLNLPKHYIAYGEFLRTPARQAARRFLKMKKRPSAIFVASDVMALEVLSVAKEMGLRVPKDLSVIGFDDNPLAADSPVKLTTFRQPIMEMGRLGLEHLKAISEGKEKLPFKMLLPAVFIERESVG